MVPSTLDKFQFSWPTLLLITFPLIALHLFKRSKSSSRSTAQSSSKPPPSPPKLPIIGNLHQLGKLPHQSLCHLSRKYGPAMLLQLGSIPTLVVSSPEMAKQVLKVHDADFCSRPKSPGARLLSYDFKDVAFSPYSDQWKERRKIFVSKLISSRRSSESLWKAREVVIDRLVESLSKEAKLINLDEKLFQVVGEIMTSFAFGRSYKEYEFEGHRSLKEVLDEALEAEASFSAEDFFPAFGWLIDYLTGHKQRLKSCFGKLDGYFEMVLQRHLHDQERPTRGFDDGEEDLVDVLIGLARGDQNDIMNLTKEHVMGFLKNMFLGGIDTTAVTLVWATTELIKNPRVMKKAQAEIRSCIGRKGKVEADDIAKMAYLRNVLKETFRLHPAAPLLIPHESLRQCRLGGHDIEPETRVLINAWAIGRDGDIWDNPGEFCPERFEGSQIDFKGADFELIPFGAGRRICPAMAMSTMTVEYVLASLLYFFDWVLPKGIEPEDVNLEEEGRLTIHKKLPLYLYFLPPKM